MSGVRSRASGLRERPGLAGYYAVSGLIVAVFSALWLFEGHYLFTAWFPALYDEVTPINGVAAGAFMTLLLACSLAALVRPRTALGPSKVLLVGAGLLAVLLPLSLASETPLVTVVLYAVAATLLVGFVRLHPARASLTPQTALDYRVLALTAVLALPFLPLALEYQWLQLTRTDAVAERWFYGGLSMYLLAILAFLVVSSVDASSRRFAGAAGVFLAGVLALVSVVYPAELHSLGTLGGAGLFVWCVAVAAVLYRT
ncbi:hypothetical protein [Natronobiforma cellulositropha]|uniref:hypothetical protein n=1 Tax=Natronobiforma cellulositropha TaxID=1679076 RepID=UPI0021D5F7C4|nr:hypothetical protein [Natronobiforma cellulositropha]